MSLCQIGQPATISFTEKPYEKPWLNYLEATGDQISRWILVVQMEKKGCLYQNTKRSAENNIAIQWQSTLWTVWALHCGLNTESTLLKVPQSTETCPLTVCSRGLGRNKVWSFWQIPKPVGKGQLLSLKMLTCTSSVQFRTQFISCHTLWDEELPLAKLTHPDALQCAQRVLGGPVQQLWTGKLLGHRHYLRNCPCCAWGGIAAMSPEGMIPCCSIRSAAGPTSRNCFIVRWFTATCLSTHALTQSRWNKGKDTAVERKSTEAEHKVHWGEHERHEALKRFDLGRSPKHGWVIERHGHRPHSFQLRDPGYRWNKEWKLFIGFIPHNQQCFTK